MAEKKGIVVNFSFDNSKAIAIRVLDPKQSISTTIEHIKQEAKANPDKLWFLPETDGGGNDYMYFLGRINGKTREILNETGENGYEQSLFDYKVKEGDELILIKKVIAGGTQSNNFTGRDARIADEWEKIEQRFSDDKQCEYIVRKRNGNGLPVVFDIVFNMKTIVNVKKPDERGLQKPEFGDEHIMRITIPNNYPGADGQPEYLFTTPVWHPNIGYHDPVKGHVCLNDKDAGTNISIVENIERVIDFLNYDDYFAENREPHPKDLTVAAWVRDQAEPQGWLHFKHDQ